MIFCFLSLDVYLKPLYLALERLKMITQKEKGIYIAVRVSPNAKRSGVEGIWQEKAFKIALRAPAVDGKANEALIDFLSELFHLKKRQIGIVHGETSREKVICLNDISLDAVQKILQPFM